MGYQELIDMGFSFEKLYKLEEWYVERFRKGFLVVELTFNLDESLHSQDVTVDDVVGLKIDFKNLFLLDKILNI
jgi:hypothetical protein